MVESAWKVTVAGVLDPGRLVFVDECGTHVALAPIHGYSPKGERVHLKVPRNRGKNTTLLASMSTEGMGPCLAVEGSTTAEVFAPTSSTNTRRLASMPASPATKARQAALNHSSRSLAPSVLFSAPSQTFEHPADG